MLTATHLVKEHGTHRALDDVSFTVRPGEIFCLLGANGAGKSTTIKLFLGFLEPTSGSAEVDGLSAWQQPHEVRRRLLYIPENVALYDELTGYENLDYFARLAAVEQRSSARLKDALRSAGLAPEAFGRRVGLYSKGMRQKVGIALAIIKEARALLLDEPTSGLDPTASAEFHELIVRQRDRGTAILMATHDLFRAREVATTIGLMQAGRLRRTLDASTITANDLENLYLEEMSRSA
ncbi:ABC transporter ATP-binding protein [Stenotrophomonas geniculata]|jgi:ABC-2 type transport system ATP-binding protein|uniref:ABC transporter ATP-binding protein n=1 Tax=Stenotrophomonas geniculata TaxID=86188 RepID=UPI000C25CBEF|nr:ATP-binding cassette domain-containing protein [Stenotrophomonas geniculata]MCI1065682.1 ATP-binding cassette domain-containing protein [Stenotrophomonas maltophilia]MCI1106802.1 ATP-binding cassette domain-containing protein [Stenotrophomonas maltophilia]MCI1110064.1 ATP-binding cassette domain-containing protein [Stenotrophomonas maltophilia]PJL70681.1 ABC transporter ATP-binding protein [Stenotrophomonas maltophilia]